jgi:hypothetical protein
LPFPFLPLWVCLIFTLGPMVIQAWSNMQALSWGHSHGYSRPQLIIFVINLLESLLKWHCWVQFWNPSLGLFVDSFQSSQSAIFILSFYFNQTLRQLGQNSYWTGHKGDKHVTIAISYL